MILSGYDRVAPDNSMNRAGRCRGAHRHPLAPSVTLLILPGRQISESCPAPFAKIFRFSFDPNQFTESGRPVPSEGRFAIVTDVGCGMRWTPAALLTRALLADGEVVWS